MQLSKADKEAGGGGGGAGVDRGGGGDGGGKELEMGVLNGRKKDNGEIKQQCLIFRDRKREGAKQKGRELESM